MSSHYYGYPTRQIENQHLRVEFLTTAGPRIVRLCVAGSSDNLLAETPDVKWETPYGDFHLYGGHRLWYAPEVFPQTSFPDDQPVIIQELADGVCLQQPIESISGLTKSIELHLAPDRPTLTLVHRLQNDGTKTQLLAPWAITQLPLGGTVLLPQRTDSDGLGPNRQLVLWPYAQWTDKRLELDQAWIQVHAWQQLPPLKIGYFNHHGRIGYLNRQCLFVKCFRSMPTQPHLDLNCNAEVYVNDIHVELETLGPSVQLAPGQAVVHEETWVIHPRVRDLKDAQARLIEAQV